MPASLVEIALYLPAAVLIGAWAGISGYSGWPFVVPVLHGVLAVPIVETLFASLWIDWANAVAASAVHLGRGTSERAHALRWALASLPLTAAAAWLSVALLPALGASLGGASGAVGLLLGAILTTRALRLGRAGNTGAVFGEIRQGADRQAGAPANQTRTRRAFYGLGMLATAVLVGLVGMGGAFTVALLQMLLRGAETRVGVATGLLYSAVAIPGALLVYAGSVEVSDLAWPRLLPFAGCAALAAALAARHTARLPERAMALLVGLCVVAAGLAATLQRFVSPG